MIVTCLIGDPVEHSVSPHLFGYFAQQCGLNEYAHVKFRVDSKKHENIRKAIEAIRTLNIAGCNVTLPYKLDVIPLIDVLDETAQAMGAVNTIVNRNSKLEGYNTDGIGAIRTIEKKLARIDKEDSILVLGAGGAARAILYEVLKRTGNVTVLNRSNDRLRRLHSDFQKLDLNFKTGVFSPDNLIKGMADAKFVINATSVGMSPGDQYSPIPEKVFETVNKDSQIKNKLFFDAIFNPYETRFLELPKTKYGAKVCSGLYMMIYQGVKAFQLWTGKEVSEEIVEKAHDLLKNILQKYA